MAYKKSSNIQSHSMSEFLFNIPDITSPLNNQRVFISDKGDIKVQKKIKDVDAVKKRNAKIMEDYKTMNLKQLLEKYPNINQGYMCNILSKRNKANQ